MADTKMEFDMKLINLVFGQLAQIEKLHGYSVKRLVIFKDKYGEFDFELDSEIVDNGR